MNVNEALRVRRIDHRDLITTRLTWVLQPLSSASRLNLPEVGLKLPLNLTRIDRFPPKIVSSVSKHLHFRNLHSHALRTSCKNFWGWNLEDLLLFCVSECEMWERVLTSSSQIKPHCFVKCGISSSSKCSVGKFRRRRQKLIEKGFTGEYQTVKSNQTCVCWKLQLNSYQPFRSSSENSPRCCCLPSF